MKPSEFKKLIKEEVHSALNEEKKYLNDMSYEELIALRKRMDFKKASREEKKYVKDLIDKKKPLSEDSEDRYTDKEMLQRTTAGEFPEYFTILDIIERYKEYVVGHLRSEGELNEVNELEADPMHQNYASGVSVELYNPLRKSIVKALDDVFMTAVKNDQSEEELDRSLKTVTDVINNILLGTIRNKKKYYKFD